MIELIYDRTQADIDLWQQLKAKGWAGMTQEEKTQWLAGLKGAYNAIDLNRVGGAMNQLAVTLAALPDELLDYLDSKSVAPDVVFEVPYDPALMDWTQKVAWQVNEIPTPEELALYLSRVALLRNTMDYDTDPLPDSMERLDYIGANAIEKALVLLDPAITAWTAQTKQTVDRTAQAWFYSGDPFAGEI